MITEHDDLKSGDKFLYGDVDGYEIHYTLQKLPDFDLWILVQDKTGGHWAGLMSTAFEAFGDWESKFTRA
jgi:hypothetical protein